MGNHADEWWYVYILRCGDDSFYTGIAKNVQLRLDQHARGRGARYTRGRGPFTIWWQSTTLSHGEALSLERRIKTMTRARKMSLGKRSDDETDRRTNS
ncbi:MAG: GIY-YIG nuclease family protein [Firmicutes bacterium]|nr:GIY-YIG nuclease family protein [Bacillota bacterium]MCL5064221.1 GIY-YIG nuclease family protein [Bacillota bacterium]